MISQVKAGAALLAALGVMATSAANAACWAPVAVEAAQVRDLDTMLMVGSLRCKINDQDFISEYNSFVRSSRPALVEANDRLRDHFDTAGGLNAYDHYVTGLANRYGAGVEGLNCRDMRSIVKSAKAEGDSLTGLVKVARSAGIQPRLPTSRCPSAVTALR
jgi:hypothetical protein